MSLTTAVTRRGTSNGNDRGSTTARRARRAWMMQTYASDVPGYARCFRCGILLYNPDDAPQFAEYLHWVRPLTIDRIIPGCNGGSYRRNNIRPACGTCNSETGGKLSHTPKPRKKPATK